MIKDAMARVRGGRSLGDIFQALRAAGRLVFGLIRSDLINLNIFDFVL